MDGNSYFSTASGAVTLQSKVFTHGRSLHSANLDASVAGHKMPQNMDLEFKLKPPMTYGCFEAVHFLLIFFQLGQPIKV